MTLILFIACRLLLTVYLAYFMKIAIGQAYNGIHKIFKKHLTALGADAFYFNIDHMNWFEVEDKDPDAYIWLADNKEERYRIIHDRVYFIENIFKKPIFPDMRMYFSEGDKVKQNQIFQCLNIPTAKTYIAAEKDKAVKIIHKIKYPFVLKDPYGYGGIHVFKIKNRQEAGEFVDKIFGAGLKTGCSLCQNIFYGQEFLPVEKDLRVITIGPKVFCAYWRIGQEGNWKHNLEQGARVSFDNVPISAVKMCQDFSRKMRFHWMGYDLFVLRDGSVKMMEYSSTARVKGAEAWGYDVRREQMKYVNLLINRRRSG